MSRYYLKVYISKEGDENVRLYKNANIILDKSQNTFSFNNTNPVEITDEALKTTLLEVRNTYVKCNCFHLFLNKEDSTRNVYELPSIVIESSLFDNNDFESWDDVNAVIDTLEKHGELNKLIDL